MQHWNSWCDVNCVPSKWGAVGEGGCRDGSETGVVGCVCKPDVTPVKAAALTLTLTLSLSLSLSLTLHPTPNPNPLTRCSTRTSVCAAP